MCSNQLWFKINVNLFNDSKIKFIRKQKKGYLIVCCFIQCMCMAGIVNDGGLIYINKNIPYTMEMLAVEFGCSVNDAEYAVKMLKDFEMIEITEEGYILVSNWAKYQNIEALENLRNRVAKSRAKKKAENETAADNIEEKAGNKKKGGIKKKETITDDNINTETHINKGNIISHNLNIEKEVDCDYESRVPKNSDNAEGTISYDDISSKISYESENPNEIPHNETYTNKLKENSNNTKQSTNEDLDSNDNMKINEHVTCNKENVTVTNCNNDVTPKIKNKKKTKNEIKKKSESKKVNSIVVVDEEDSGDNLLVHFSDEIEHMPDDKVLKSFSFNECEDNNANKKSGNCSTTIPAIRNDDASLTVNTHKFLHENDSGGVYYDTCINDKSDAAIRLLRYYEDLTGNLGGMDYGQMKIFVVQHGEAYVKKAIEKAVSYGKKDGRYINGILMNWRKEGYPEDEGRVRKDGGKPKCNKESNEADTGFKVPKRRKLTEAEKRRLEEKYAND